MTNSESYPRQPIRTSSFDRLASLPTPQEMMRPRHPQKDETSALRYIQSTDGYGLPVVDDDMPFTAADSGEIRQAALPPQEAMQGQDARWMSAEEVAAYIDQAEREELARLEVETSSNGQTNQRQLHVRYEGPEAQIKLRVVEGVDGRNIDRILGAFTGMAGQPAEIVSPRPTYYSGSSEPVLPPAVHPQLPAAPSHSSYEDENLQVAVQEQQLTIDNMLDAPQEEKPRTNFFARHRKRIIGLAAVATAPLWYQPALGIYQSVGDVAYETARQGINGEFISVSEAFQVFGGQAIDEENK